MRRFQFLLLATAAFAPGAALAAEEATSVSELQVVGQLRSYAVQSATTATKIDAPPEDIPQSIDVVSGELIQAQRALSMQDVLRNVPGVGLSSGDGQRDQVSIRGFSAIADQFVDGFRDDALYFRDLSNIERVEVLKGPASVLYGRGSSGGLINRVTKKPGLDLSSIALSYGGWNDRRAEFDLARAALDALDLGAPHRSAGGRGELSRPAVPRPQGAGGRAPLSAGRGDAPAAAGRLSVRQAGD